MARPAHRLPRRADPPLGLTVVGGVAARSSTSLSGYADTLPSAGEDGHPYHLALWHGLEPALFLSLGSIAVGALLFWATYRRAPLRRVLPFTAPTCTTARSAASPASPCGRRPSRSAARCRSTSARSSSCSSRRRARRSSAVVSGAEWQVFVDAWQTPMQLVVAPIMILAGVFAVRAQKRYTGVVLVSVTGLGMVALFATSGAPDLALTQILVETVTLVAFALVLRRIPARMGEHNASVWPSPGRCSRSPRRDDGDRRDRRDRIARRRADLDAFPTSPTSSDTARTS
jgi:multicomponent Na+:H+ antiporter subunit A